MTASIVLGDSDSVLTSFALDSNKDIKIINTSTSGDISIKLGTTNNTTKFSVLNSSDEVLFEVKGDGYFTDQETAPTTLVTIATTGASSHTWTAAQLLSGLIIRSTLGGHTYDRLLSAADLVAALSNPKAGDVVNLSVYKKGSHKCYFLTSLDTTFVGVSGQWPIRAVCLNNRTTNFKIVLQNVGSGTEAAEMMMQSRY